MQNSETISDYGTLTVDEQGPSHIQTLALEGDPRLDDPVEALQQIARFLSVVAYVV